MQSPMSVATSARVLILLLFAGCSFTNEPDPGFTMAPSIESSETDSLPDAGIDVLGNEGCTGSDCDDPTSRTDEDDCDMGLHRETATDGGLDGLDGILPETDSGFGDDLGVEQEEATQEDSSVQWAGDACSPDNESADSGVSAD